MSDSPPSVTNRLARRIALASFVVAVIMAGLDGAPFYEANSTYLMAFLGAALGFILPPTYRNVREYQADKAAQAPPPAVGKADEVDVIQGSG